VIPQRKEANVGGIFISYRREDSAAWAGRVWEHLKEAFGSERVFIDVDSLNLGEDFLEVIERYIAATDVMLVMIGRRWLAAVDGEGRRRIDLDDDFVALEVGQALEQGRRVIPVLVDNAPMPTAEQLPAQLNPLARRHAIELTHSGFRRDIQGLIDALSPLLAEDGPRVGVSTTPEPAPANPAPDPQGARTSNEPPRAPKELDGAGRGEPPRPRGRRRAVIAGGIGASVLLLASWLVGGDESTSDACAAVDIAVSPEKIELLSDLAQTFNQSDRARFDGTCVEVIPYSKSSGLGASLLIDGWDEEAEGPKPVIWSPASSAWGAVVDHRLSERGEDQIAGEGSPFMLTPLVIAMPEPMADALGWPETPIGWADVYELSTNEEGWAAEGHPEWGQFRLGKTNPRFSTSGLSALIAQSYAATGTEGDLTIEDLQDPAAVEFATGLESAVVHYGETTLTFLNNLYRADQRGTALSYASAIAVEEKSVIDYNLGNPDGITQEGEDPQPPRVLLVAIYPEEGTVMSDNPLFLLDAEWVSDLEREGAQRFEDFVQEPTNQERVLEYGFRPANPEVEVGPPISTENGVDPDQPETILTLPAPAVLAELLELWDDQRRPARVELVIDVSGSMGDIAEGDSGPTKLDLAKEAALGAIPQLGPRDVVGLRVFSTNLGRERGQEVLQLVPPAVLDEAQQLALKDAINGLEPESQTPLYSATQQAFEDATAAYDADSINAIVLLSDGMNADGNTTDDQDQLEELLRTLEGEEGTDTHPVRVFPIAYGADADMETLKMIADATGAAVYDASDPTTIDRVLAAVISNF
jgi:Ca-activated chloride channel homolog